jgi:hypothetical protein
MTGQDPKRWAVSKTRSVALSRGAIVDVETERYQVLSNSIRDLTSEVEVVEEIGKLWKEAQEKFLAIGRYLVRAKERFHRTFEATILPQLPFGKGVAYQLRAVAMAVDEGLLLEEELPNSYATAYQLVTLPADHMQLARKENLVRRDVLRREVEAFKARLRLGSDSDKEARLLQEWRHLRSEMTRMGNRLAEIEGEIGPKLRESGLLGREGG